MTKEKILEFFKDINSAYNNCNMLDSLSRMLDELPNGRQWTSISEKQPPYGINVLLYTKRGNQIVGHRVNIYGHDMYADDVMGSGYISATHWMDLPEPPKESDYE